MTIISAISLAILIIFSLPLIFSNLAQFQMNSNDKTISFECGFNPLTPNRMTFSTQFFLISILFLIFDLEIVLILPLPMEENKSTLNLSAGGFLLVILMGGLIMEWKQGMLEWSK